MRFEVMVVSAAEVDRASDLYRVGQAVGAAIGAIGDLDRAAWVAQSYSEHPQAAVTQPYWVHTAVAGAFGNAQPEPARALQSGPHDSNNRGLR